MSQIVKLNDKYLDYALLRDIYSLEDKGGYVLIVSPLDQPDKEVVVFHYEDEITLEAIH